MTETTTCPSCQSPAVVYTAKNRYLRSSPDGSLASAVREVRTAVCTNEQCRYAYEVDSDSGEVSDRGRVA